MRVGIIALLHESNTFVTCPTTLADFQGGVLAEASAVRDAFQDSHHEVSGFLAALDAAPDVEAVPIFAARALPSGAVEGAAFEELLRRIFQQLQQCGPLDGVLAAPHGATVAQSHPDADGHWLTELRRRVGADVPIIATIDPHANLSPAMVSAVDALIAYRSNPHLDQRQRGEQAAKLMVSTLRGEVRPVVAASFPPLAINIERQHTSEPHCQRLYQAADHQLAEPRLLSNSIVLGFPYADVGEMGSALVAVADSDAQLAQRSAASLAQLLWDHRQEFVGQLYDIDETLDQCESLKGPICLLDMGDNVGGGSAADGTVIAHALHRRQIARSLVCICDPESVGQARQAGSGQSVQLSVGGKVDDQHGEPLRTTFHVRSLHDGKFQEPQPRHGGFSVFDQGRTAIVETEHGLTIMLTSRRMVPFSLQQLYSCQLDPASFRFLVAKGVNAPVAAYQPVCAHLKRVNTPGSTCADMRQLAYRRRRRPLFPFEPDTQWRAGI